MKKILSLIPILIILHVNLFGQDVHFTQLNSAPLMTNPALTGAFSANHRIIVNYRSQWRNVTDSYITYGLSYDLGFLKKELKRSFLALGIQFFNDQSGDIKLGLTHINLSIAYHLSANMHNVLAVGLQGGWYEKRLNVKNMIFGNQYDASSLGGYNPALPHGESMPFINIDYGDFSAGILWSYNSRKSTVNTPETKKVSVGLALFHINRPRQTFSNSLTERLYMKFAYHINSSIGFKNSRFFLLPSTAGFFQGPTYDVVFGNLFGVRLKKISYYTDFNPETSIAIGAHYRIKDAIIIMGQLDWKNFLFCLSYDINTSKLYNASKGAGGFEVSIRFMAPVSNAGKKNLY